MGLLNIFRKKRTLKMGDVVNVADKALGELCRGTGMTPCRCPNNCKEGSGIYYYAAIDGKNFPKCKVCGSVMKPL